MLLKNDIINFCVLFTMEKTKKLNVAKNENKLCSPAFE